MFILDQTNSIANTFIAELRDVDIQNDRLKFRNNLQRLGEILAYEISKSFDFFDTEIQTPLGVKSTKLIIDQPILISVLRAALPFYQGFLNFFDKADSGFVGAYRKENFGMKEVEIEYLYQALPEIEGKILILIDPMLASGNSFVKTINNILKKGNPKMIHIVSVIAAPEGVNLINGSLNIPFKLWTCSLDERLDDRAYINPGLGDAGDLCFGDKI
jgi:uracil phosphoribosyltransferase